VRRFFSVVLLCAISAGAVIADDKPVSFKQLSELGIIPGPSGSSEETPASRQALADQIAALMGIPPGTAPIVPPMFDIDTGALAVTSPDMGTPGFGVVADQTAFHIFAFLNSSLSQSR